MFPKNIKIIWAVFILDLLFVLFAILSTFPVETVPADQRVQPVPMVHPPADWKGVK